MLPPPVRKSYVGCVVARTVAEFLSEFCVSLVLVKSLKGVGGITAFRASRAAPLIRVE